MTAEPKFRTKSRLNGWSCPPHPFQFIAWGFYLYFGLIYFSAIVPALVLPWQPAAYAAVGLSFLIHLVVHIGACSVNPADTSVRNKTKKSMPTFNRARHKHVIENQHCYLCEVDVGPQSKHCSACNKCVADFDHHCKWLNNCVGGRNYKLFIATLVSSLIGCFIIFAISVLCCTAHFSDKNNGHILLPYQFFLSCQTAGNSTSTASLVSSGNSTTGCSGLSAPVFEILYQPVSDVAWLCVLGITAVLALIAVGLLAHLLGFHIYLMCRSLSTYDYIVMQREKAEQEAREREIDESETDPAKFRPLKTNKVVPSQAKQSDIEGQEKDTHIQYGGSMRDYAMAAAEADEDRESGETPPPPPIPPPTPPDSPKVRKQKRTKKQKRQKEKRSPKGNRANESIDMAVYSDRRGSHDAATAGRNPAIDHPGVYTPRGFTARLDVQVPPVAILPPPPSGIAIRPAAPARDYHSDSAESLEEIPANLTYTGSIYGVSPRVSNLGKSSSHNRINTLGVTNLTKSVSHDKLDSSRATEFGDVHGSSSMHSNLSQKWSSDRTLHLSPRNQPEGAANAGGVHRTLPPPPPLVSRQRPLGVPPLDLSALRTIDSHRHQETEA